ncbi:MAG: hypothetical protein M1814_003180 [Vezdaea aestivalis]|nr:MAG: hypothetical protein M1814_003180 [Vezdaea aestivalis]
MADRVFCHQCSNEWARSEHGLICPECDSEFTEVIESSNDPRHVPIEDPDAFPPQLPHPSYSTHNPWTPIPAANAPDPDDADIERHVTTTRVPGSITYTTTTIRTGGQGGFQSRTTRTTNSRSAAIPISAPNSPFPELFRLLGGLGGPSAAPTYPSFPGDPSRVDRSRRNSDRGEPGSRLGGRFSYTSNAPWNQQDEIPEGNPGDPMAEMARFLATLSGTIPGDEGSGIQHLLHNLLAPGNAVGGDAVYSQEGFDRVITNLMEQNGSGNTPAPASRAAISSLPTRAIEESDFGDGGQAECNICMDEVELGEKSVEYLSLPIRRHQMDFLQEAQETGIPLLLQIGQGLLCPEITLYRSDRAIPRRVLAARVRATTKHSRSSRAEALGAMAQARADEGEPTVMKIFHRVVGRHHIVGEAIVDLMVRDGAVPGQLMIVQGVAQVLLVGQPGLLIESDIYLVVEAD